MLTIFYSSFNEFTRLQHKLNGTNPTRRAPSKITKSRKVDTLKRNLSFLATIEVKKPRKPARIVCLGCFGTVYGS